MNIIDIVILGFILLYALNGMYKGFLPSLLNLGGFFLSWIGAFLFYPLLSGAFIKSDFFQSFRFYIEGAEKVNNYEIVNTPVASLSSGDIASIMENAKLPSPYHNTILHNLENQGAVKAYEQAAPTGRTRRYYHITKKGLRILEEQKKDWNTFSEKVNAVIAGCSMA